MLCFVIGGVSKGRKSLALWKVSEAWGLERFLSAQFLWLLWGSRPAAAEPPSREPQPAVFSLCKQVTPTL